MAVQHQTFGHLALFAQYQITLLGDRSKCV